MQASHAAARQELCLEELERGPNDGGRQSGNPNLRSPDMSKVIITGATGLVGSALVRHCIDHAGISAIIVLSRKPLPEALAKSEKVTVIIHQDFSSYPPGLLEKLKGSSGCLWCVGPARLRAKSPLASWRGSGRRCGRGYLATGRGR